MLTNLRASKTSAADLSANDSASALHRLNGLPACRQSAAENSLGGHVSWLKALRRSIGTLVLAASLVAMTGCADEESTPVSADGAANPTTINFQYAEAERLLQENGYKLQLQKVEQVDPAPATLNATLNLLLGESYVIGLDDKGSLLADKVSLADAGRQLSLRSSLEQSLRGKDVLAVRASWESERGILVSIGILDESTGKLLFDPLLTLTPGRNYALGDTAATRTPRFPKVTQPSNPGDLYNSWGENIFGGDLYTFAISWGTAFCNEQGCIVVPGNPNIWIQVEVESSFGWSADAMVSSVQVSPDCKSATFQVTLAAAGPLATLDVQYDAKGVKVGASVKGSVGTYKKTFNATWNCP